MNIARQPLIKVLCNAKVLLARPGNEFIWAPWENVTEALREIDIIIEILQSGRRFNKTHTNVLFGPTGPIQEVSVSSGWGAEFLVLAQWYDLFVTFA